MVNIIINIILLKLKNLYGLTLKLKSVIKIYLELKNYD